MLFTPVTMLGYTIREHVQRPLLKLLRCYDALHPLRIALPVMSAQGNHLRLEMYTVQRIHRYCIA